MCTIIGDVQLHKFIGHYLIPLDPCNFDRLVQLTNKKLPTVVSRNYNCLTTFNTKTKYISQSET